MGFAYPSANSRYNLDIGTYTFTIYFQQNQIRFNIKQEIRDASKNINILYSPQTGDHIDQRSLHQRIEAQRYWYRHGWQDHLGRQHVCQTLVVQR